MKTLNNALPISTLVKNQKQTTTTQITFDGEPCDLVIEVRHDDCCGNGHNSFAITGSVYKAGRRSDWAYLTGGCIHDIIAEHAPELAPLIKWHLTSTDGPMHYLANSLYHARDTDCHGRRAGEPSRFEYFLKFEGFPIRYPLTKKLREWVETMETFNLEVYPIAHASDPETFKPKYTVFGYPAELWHECPFDSEREAFELLEALQTTPFEIEKVATAWSLGGESNLEGARSCAVWPDAELSDFTESALTARLSALMIEFKAAVESLGLTY